MKHYRATPQDGREPIVRRGLPALYEAAREAFGLTATFASVRGNMLPGGRFYRGTDGLRVHIGPDPAADAEYEAAQANAVVNDDRQTDYMANFTITAKWSSGEDGVEFQERRVRAKGLMELFQKLAEFVQAKTGGYPPGLDEASLRARLPNIRSQMSKSRAAGKTSYMVMFPKPGDGYWRTPRQNWESRVYVDIAAQFEPLPPIYTFTRRTKE